MIKSFRFAAARIVASLAIALIPAMIPVVVHAQDLQNNACAGANINLNGGSGDCGPAAGDKVSGIIKQVINIFSAVVGAVSVIMIIIGGFRYITSGGESSSVSGAKNTIIYAIIGLVVVVLAQLIVQFVLNKTANSAV